MFVCVLVIVYTIRFTQLSKEGLFDSFQTHDYMPSAAPLRCLEATKEPCLTVTIHRSGVQWKSRGQRLGIGGFLRVSWRRRLEGGSHETALRKS
jgi:hypothetical protein